VYDGLDAFLPIRYPTVGGPNIKCNNNFAVSSAVRFAQGGHGEDRVVCGKATGRCAQILRSHVDKSSVPYH
jgi:hypothetical protein